MKNVRPIVALALLLCLGATILPPQAVSTGGDGEGTVSTGGTGDGSGGGGSPPPYDCTKDPSNRVDCGSNDMCPGISWPAPQGSQATSTGHLGGSDTDDWANVELYRTETLSVTSDHGAVTYATPACGSMPLDKPTPTNVNQGGDYAFDTSVPAGLPEAASHVAYAITPNDATGPGTDVGNVAAAAYPVTVAPSDAGAAGLLQINGSLPDREMPDVDWFRFHSTLAETPGVDGQPRGLALGLLSATFSPDCNGGTYTMTLYQSDGMTAISSASGCGSAGVTLSCITAGYTAVYAELTVGGKGTGYTLAPSLSPLYLVNVDNGTAQDFAINPQVPWCDPLLPMILGVAQAGNAVANEVGDVLAGINPAVCPSDGGSAQVNDPTLTQACGMYVWILDQQNTLPSQQIYSHYFPGCIPETCYLQATASTEQVSPDDPTAPYYQAGASPTCRTDNICYAADYGGGSFYGFQGWTTIQCTPGTTDTSFYAEATCVSRGSSIGPVQSGQLMPIIEYLYVPKGTCVTHTFTQGVTATLATNPEGQSYSTDPDFQTSKPIKVCHYSDAST